MPRRLVLLTLALVVLCTGAARAQSPNPDTARVLAIVPAFKAYVQQGMELWQVPGLAVAIVALDNAEGESGGYQVVWSAGFGTRTLGRDEPVDTQTVFQIGSTSKAFTSALMATLVDAQAVGWNDKVIDHFPTFRMYDPWVTREFEVRDLMAQRSGLPSHSGDGQILFGTTRDKLVAGLAHLTPVSSFRSEFAYQNNLFVAAAALMEHTTGATWEDLLTERIFGPLGMARTSTTSTALLAEPNHASLHMRNGADVIRLPDDWPYLYWSYAYGPAGGINSCIDDMARWLAMHMNRGVLGGTRVISEQNADYLHSPQTLLHFRGMAYCQAWMSEPLPDAPIIWHNGETSGAHAMIAFSPSDGLGLVVLSNLNENNLPDALARWFIDRYRGNPDRDWAAESHENLLAGQRAEAEAEAPVEHPAPAREPAAYAGTYENAVCGRIEILAADGGLSGRIVLPGGRALALPGEHRTGDTFRLHSQDLPGMFFDATFAFDARGQCTGFTADEDFGMGIGPFVRLADEE